MRTLRCGEEVWTQSYRRCLLATTEDTAMTKDQKIIRAKAGLLELAKQLGNVLPGLQDHGLQPGQLASALRTVRQRRRDRSAGRVEGAEPRASANSLAEVVVLSGPPPSPARIPPAGASPDRTLSSGSPNLRHGHRARYAETDFGPSRRPRPESRSVAKKRPS